MDFSYVIMTPFVWVLDTFYSFVGSYGIALILFTLVVRLILFPVSLKGKKSMIQMNMLSGKLQKLQKQYAKDQARYQEEMQKLYEKEGVNPMGGCLWSFLPLLILFPLYAIIRQPLKYMMGMTYQQMVDVGNNVLGWATVASQNGWIKEAAQLTEAIYESVCLRLLEVGEFARSEVWCGRLSAQYPDSLAAYTCRLKLYFSTKNREAFFDTLAELKRSPVVIDGETLELIKVFS